MRIVMEAEEIMPNIEGIVEGAAPEELITAILEVLLLWNELALKGRPRRQIRNRALPAIKPEESWHTQ